jgi:hypothetical protein
MKEERRNIENPVKIKNIDMIGIVRDIRIGEDHLAVLVALLLSLQSKRKTISKKEEK